MVWFLGFCALLLAASAVGAFGLWWAWLGLDAVGQLLRLRPSPAARLAEGPAALAGAVEADAPLPSGHGAPCALVHVRLQFTVDGGHSPTPLQHNFYAPGAALRDASGRCPLGPGPLLLCGPQRSWTLTPDEFRRRFPHYVALAEVSWSLGSVTVIEETIEIGSSVLASGHAAPDPDEPPQSYRRSGGPQLRLGGLGGDKLLVAVGPRPLAVARALLPSLLMALVAAATLGLTATLGYVAFLL